MRFVKPKSIIAGFHADRPCDAVVELVHVGEQWAPREYPIPRHAHPVWEFYLQLDGTSVWRDSTGRSYRCPPGAFFAPPPRVEHWLERTTGTKHHFYFAAIDVERALSAQPSLHQLVAAWRRVRHAPIHVAGAFQVEPAFRTLIRECSMDRPFRGEGIRAAVDSLLVHATRLLTAGSDRPLVAEHPAVETVRRVLTEHPGEPWRLRDLGRLTSTSPNHLASLFTQSVGVTPARFLLRQRIDRATDLLTNTDTAITAIAHGLGFGSSQHFARAYRAATGRTPTAVRRRHIAKTRSAR